MTGLEMPEVHEITKNVLAVTNLYHASGKRGTNAGIIFTGNEAVFIDTGMTIASAEFLWETALSRMNQKDLHLNVILTHHHSDHVFGMQLFKEKKATIYAHENVRDFLENDRGQYKQFILDNFFDDPKKGDKILGDVILSLPDHFIEKDTILFDDEVHVLFTPGHVSSELSVYHPDSKTLFAGDTIYEGMSPNTRFGGSNEWRTWISHLERIKKLDIDTIVPGHGNLCSKDEIDNNINYLKELLK
ncbi:MAG: MBL fold metallo-hydrolase [Theionarchaea archaeon]|nr:MBL fold metallo-hydrolase [Theionarchaea archaeon]